MRGIQYTQKLLLATVSLVSHRDKSACEQKDILKDLIQTHEKYVKQNTTTGAPQLHSTYTTDSCSFLPCYNLATLPVTSGAYRDDVRAALVQDTHRVRTQLRELVLQPWQSCGPRHAVFFGIGSSAYLQKQLEKDKNYSFLVIDRSLKQLANAAAALAPRFGHRVWFLRSEAMFTSLELLEPNCADVVIVPMPVPIASARGSHRRLVTCDFLCAVNCNLRVREDRADPRGVVIFTDCEPYADFIMEQLEESKLMVPWTRKRPQLTYGRWLPNSAQVRVQEKEGEVLCATASRTAEREFGQQRRGSIVAIAASKSSMAAPQAVDFIRGYDYKRRYFRALQAESV